MTSQRWKLRLFLFNISCCVAAAYFFRRHNTFCEAGGECQCLTEGHMVVLSLHFLSVLSALQSTPCSPSLSTWWCSPTWPSTWRPSGTSGLKRWWWLRHQKTSTTDALLANVLWSDERDVRTDMHSAWCHDCSWSSYMIIGPRFVPRSECNCF